MNVDQRTMGGNQLSDRKTEGLKAFTLKTEKSACSYFLLVSRDNGDSQNKLLCRKAKN